MQISLFLSTVSLQIIPFPINGKWELIFDKSKIVNFKIKFSIENNNNEITIDNDKALVYYS